MGMSPDGENVVTGAGDESLRFWKVFPGVKEERSVRRNLFDAINIAGGSGGVGKTNMDMVCLR